MHAIRDICRVYVAIAKVRHSYLKVGVSSGNLGNYDGERA